MSVLFPYELRKDGKVIEDSMLQVEVTQAEIKEIAKKMESNGGFPVDTCELTNLSNRIYDTLYIDVLTEKFPGEENFDNYEFYLCDRVPEELIEKAEEFVMGKVVDQNFYLMVDGEEVRSSLNMGISHNAFQKMKEVIQKGPFDLSDFDRLKLYYPNVYEEVAGLILEWAYKYCIREYNEEKECILKEFSYQIYEDL